MKIILFILTVTIMVRRIFIFFLILATRLTNYQETILIEFLIRL